MEMDKLALEILSVTEYTAIRAGEFMGTGDEVEAERHTIKSMWEALKAFPFCGEVVMGEGLPGNIEHLYDGEHIGACHLNTIDFSFAMKAIEGTTPCVTGGTNAISVIGIAHKGDLMRFPPVYMNKIAVGPEAKDLISFDTSTAENLRSVAEAKNIPINYLTVIVLDRPRNRRLIREIRETGARVKLIGDGDVAAAIATSIEGTGIDLLMGIGGAREGVIAATAIKGLGGQILGKLWFSNEDQRIMAREFNLDIEKVFDVNSMVKGDSVFAATGITDGDLLEGVKFVNGKLHTQSLIIDSITKTFRKVESVHQTRS